MVAPLFITKWVHKVLMDGGSVLNIVYMSTLDSMGIQRSQLRPSSIPFHGVIPGTEAVPLVQIDLVVTFGDEGNFCKETLTFEVVGFPRTYHVILGRSAYAKFMEVPNYTCLKLKMPRPKGFITIGTKLQHAYECDVECFHFADSLIPSNELAEEPVPEVLGILGNRQMRDVLVQAHKGRQRSANIQRQVYPPHRLNTQAGVRGSACVFLEGKSRCLGMEAV
jgi:hypothetical protein